MYMVMARCHLDDVPLRFFTENTPARAKKFLQTLDIDAELRDHSWPSSAVVFVAVYKLEPVGDGTLVIGEEVDSCDFKEDSSDDQK